MSRSPADVASARTIVAAYPVVREPLTLVRFGSGLINDTFEVRTGEGAYILQRLHPVFEPEIHHNIEAVTLRLQERGMSTPRLIRDRSGALFVTDEAGCAWRMMTRIEGYSFDKLESAQQAEAAGALLGRFHRSLDALEHRFVGLRSGIHDTPAHLARLEAALADHPDHRLIAQVAPIAESILEAASKLPAIGGCPSRIVHGDPKFNNVLFAGESEPLRDHALCWIDLDTVAPMPLAFELGDAWRSWCNPLGEDVADARFSLPAFEASWRGYRREVEGWLTAQERTSLVHGVEWITLELASRFLADALQERYFGWNRQRFTSAGEHNLLRARGQWSLHCAVMACRAQRERLLQAL